MCVSVCLSIATCRPSQNFVSINELRSFSSFPSLHVCHSSFSNPSVTLPTSQFILQSFRCFTYVTAHSPTLLSLLLRHRFSLTSSGEPPMAIGVIIKHITVPQHFHTSFRFKNRRNYSLFCNMQEHKFSMNGLS